MSNYISLILYLWHILTVTEYFVTINIKEIRIYFLENNWWSRIVFGMHEFKRSQSAKLARARFFGNAYITSTLEEVI